ncbi:MAG: DUF2804 domain-containing protein [Oscillospiraceae bacterium]|nr:DUF2804 domain-containing protein [Oscillospiraceae bacterium]
MQTEITEKGPLLNEDGSLAARGWARTLIRDYERSAIKAPAHRIKEWDYYYTGNSRFGVALTVADNSYMGLLSASLLEFGEAPRETTKSVMTLLPLGSFNMPSTSTEGDVHFENKSCQFLFSNDGGGTRRLLAQMSGFEKGLDFACDITLADEPPESIVMMTPFAENKRAFYYNQKINCLRASGAASVGDKIYEFDPAESFAVLDWGRGVWTYSNTWYWGSASGLVGGRPFGFNIGYGFGDVSAASENIVFYEGRGHKLSQVNFGIPMKDGREDYLSKWSFTSDDGRFEMEFSPLIDRASCTSALIIKSDQHQVFGIFSGRVRLDGGETLEIKELPGFAEKVANRW